ncbi:deoxyribose-phosphate aldolase [Paenibacillus montaniterrae]|uniref:Deoxyribose-phosphate aldolase n=1 Tax=Paenibacillus montaniterrae TaxID=429341 RepID=A0A919YTQ3_9BACL|nr:deoxyribose-phosphate aldolase [Paenibacillus montaniterrae]GIP17974.1 deoxyribose-phosphate aldolase [Paenibacillus montaniterrae]
MNRNELAAMIDHTLLKAGATEQEIIQLCAEAAQYQFATVCVNPCWVKLAAEQLKDADRVGVTTVIGFPLGASSSAIKALETKQAIHDGATEIDMVLNIGYLKSRFLSAVKSDIEAVVAAAANRAIVKVILETCLLTDEEIVEACKLAVEAGAHYVKTSTGFSSGGATAEHIQLMRRTVGEHIGVKASGGIRDYATAIAMVEAGASRIGASAGIAIVDKAEAAATDY